MKKHPEKYGFKTALLMGIVFYPIFIILDLIVYPDYIAVLIAIRAVVLVCLIASYVLMDKLDERYFYALMYVSFMSCLNYTKRIPCSNN